MKTALIFGVSGQDGAYLARLLVAKGYLVHGTSRDAVAHPFNRLESLGIRGLVIAHTVATTDRDAVRRLLTALQPDEIYNLSGLSSVARSFAEPASAWSSIADAHALLLESASELVPAARIYHSSSSECFGDLAAGSAADEDTPFAPLSPYAAAKAAAHRVTADFRAQGLFACSGIVFNHESPLRPEGFVTRKITAGAAAIAAGLAHELPLGDLSASRDWGYAAEYVEAMWRMLQQPEPADFVLATGESHTVEELAAAAFAEFGLDHRRYVTVDPSLLRRAEIRYSRGDASRAKRILGWEAGTKFRELVKLLVDHEAEVRGTRDEGRVEKPATAPTRTSCLVPRT
ncbi:MAG TPA: GDP-mannose 4,6-dehydratase [Thermoanaerobaculia bacterium]|nr:GDP-mannose 4,6-dehydratase [Thermoanaerobaculia bacterium]